MVMEAGRFFDWVRHLAEALPALIAHSPIAHLLLSCKGARLLLKRPQATPL